MRNKNKISLVKNLYSIFTAFLILSTNFLPLLNFIPATSFAQEVPLTNNIILEESNSESQDENIPKEDNVVEEKPLVSDIQTPEPEIVETVIEPQTPKVIEKPEVETIEKAEVIVVDSGVGALNTIAENVVYDCNATSTLSCVTTDKEDYSPIDIVKISGYAYEENGLYQLVIYSNDNPAVNFETNVIASENGTFEYSYQLDGNYRPQYYIEVHKVSLDSSNEIVKTPIAKSSFTDSATIVGKCMEDSAGFNLNCTANDISLANVSNINILDDGCAFPGDTVTFKATWDVKSTAQQRYDIGLYFAADGQSNAKNGNCSVSTLPTTPMPPFYDYDGDSCGDVKQDKTVQPVITMTVKCMDTDGDNKLNLPYCTSWKQSGDNQTCTSPSNAIPGAPSKCKCDNGFEIPIVVPYSAKIEVVKDLVPSSDSGRFNLLVDGSNKAACVGDNGTTSKVTVSAGTSTNPGAIHTVSETTTGCSTDLSDYTSSISCVDRGLSTFNGGAPLTVNNSGPLNVPVKKNQDIVCTITNTVINGNLIVKKVVIGSQESPSTFSFKVNAGNDIQFENDGQNDIQVQPGIYNIVENSNPYYTTTYDNCSNLIISNGETETCTITNTLKQSSLKVVKTVVNDNGGTKQIADFNLYINGVSAISGQSYTLPAGNYSVSEDQIFGYKAGDWGTDCSADGKVTLLPGDNKTCTITNNDIAPELTVIKKVINDNGGLLESNDFTMQVTGTNVSKTSFAGADLPGVTVTLDAGNYSVDEINLDGYSKSLSSDCIDSISVGEKKTCTITNDDISPRLIVKKHVINDNGGKLLAPDFTLNITGTNLSKSSVNGNEAGVDVFLDAGTYSVDENEVYGYAKTIGENCSGTIAIGETKVCTITNDDIQPSLKVTKLINNTYNGTLLVTDVTLLVKTTEVESGVVNYFDAGDYIVSEEPIQGYTGVIGGHCGPDGSVTLEVGDNKECIITNSEIQPKLTVVKVVVNDDGGSKAVADFPLFVDGKLVVSGQKNGFFTGTYTVSETQANGYTATFSGACDSNGVVILNSGDDKTCTITNDDIAPKLTVIKEVKNDNGGEMKVEDFPLYVGKDLVISGVKNSYRVGDYYVSEIGNDAYSATFSGACSSDGKVTLNPGDDKTCTIVNDDIPPKLIVNKIVDNKYGGTLKASDFVLKVNDNQVTNGAINTLPIAGNYVVSENIVKGYTGVFSEDCDENGNINIKIGETKTCTITNYDKQPSLTLIKTVNNYYGGTLLVENVDLYVGAIEVDSGVKTYLNAGNYQVSETNIPGYEASSWTGDCSFDGKVTLEVGDDKVCYITNTDIQPKLTVIKEVQNNNGGTMKVEDFPLYVGDKNVKSGEVNGFNVGKYVVSEIGNSGYTAVFSGSCDENGNVILNLADSKVCKITNYDKPGKLIVNKIVIGSNDNPSIFSFDVNGLNKTSFESDGSNELTVKAGTYTVTEENNPYYTTTYDNCTRVNVDNGETEVCTITNTLKESSLTVIKEVRNDNGGTKLVSDFNLYINGKSVTSGQKYTLPAGNYTVSEDQLFGYKASDWGTDCKSDGTVTLVPGENKVCTIVNDDISPELTIIKTVINNDGGKLSSSDFTIKVNGTNVSNPSFKGQEAPGTVVYLNAGNYSVDEIETEQETGYAKTLGENCSGTISVGEKKTCIITNNDIAPTLTVIKTVVNDNGGILSENDFNLKVGDSAVNSGDTNTFKAGEYTLTETPTDAYTPSIWGTDCSENGTITLMPGDNKTCTITNDDKPGVLNVVKVVDTKEELYYSYNDFSFILNGDKEFTFDYDGKNDDVNDGQAGVYTVIENENPYYTTSYDNCFEVIVKNGEEQTCTITNTPIIPELEIIKTNNANGDKVIGDTVEYTIQLNITKGFFVTNSYRDSVGISIQRIRESIPSIEVFDVTPNGFSYISGSWKGYLNDVQMNSSVLPEPSYSSPGTWKIFTDVKEGDVIKLVYSALIGNESDPGLYKDLAYAYGNTPFMTQEYAKGIGSWTNGTFVGTEVNVVNPTVQEDGVVLGVSIVELPRTGTSSIFTIAALIMGVIGLLSVILGLNLKTNTKMKSLILGIITAPLLLTAFNSNVSAAYILRVEEPKSATKSTFKIDYVALDTDGNSVNVKCEVVKPSTSSVVFSNKTTKAGGDSDKCDITMAELSEGDGKYTFKVYANDDNTTTQTFNVVYDTQKPLAPVSFKKTENICSYKIEFKTANDAGQTVKVEIFRSTQKSFDANDSTLVGTVNIGSNSQGLFNNDKPNCDKDYFYAIRSVDAAGNTSDFIGDKITETKVVIVDGVNENVENNTGNQTDNSGEVAGEDTDGNNGEKDEDKNNNGIPDNQENEQTDNKGDVEGSETSNQNVERNNTVAIVSGVALGSLLIWQLSKYGILQSIFQKIMKIFVRK